MKAFIISILKEKEILQLTFVTGETMTVVKVANEMEFDSTAIELISEKTNKSVLINLRNLVYATPKVKTKKQVTKRKNNLSDISLNDIIFL
ncbi:Fibronectin type III domain protein [Streptococcus parauberis KCTC 11537]|uniref:hypothetical protein n=1 Tax=Streptococcus parauberis TaxID=1348 RepID=UPI00020CC054|nr:hypothetical protein [Streptococcus parauberis]AEF24897.1 Fibronectin type III domain protein [Streptococcus parauberis KCTC 11537]